MEARELTRAERTAIRKLVIAMCANYDKAYGCLPLDCECYMLQKMVDGGLLQVFQKRRPAPRPGAGAVFDRPRRGRGVTALRCVRDVVRAGRQAGLLLRGLRGGRKAQTAAGIYASKTGVER